MALATQTKILRVLQEGEIQRVGGTETIKVDVRVLAATNKDLEEIVKARTFREDLYYRLNVVRIRMPPLRERLEDIPQIVDYLLQTLEKQKKTRVQEGLGRGPGRSAAAPVAGQRARAGERHLPQRRHRAGRHHPVEGPAAGDPWTRRPRRGRAPPFRWRRPEAAPLARPPSPRRPRITVREAPQQAPASPSLTLQDALDFVYARLKEEGKEPVLERLEREMIDARAAGRERQPGARFRAPRHDPHHAAQAHRRARAEGVRRRCRTATAAARTRGPALQVEDNL